MHATIEAKYTERIDDLEMMVKSRNEQDLVNYSSSHLTQPGVAAGSGSASQLSSLAQQPNISAQQQYDLIEQARDEIRHAEKAKGEVRALEKDLSQRERRLKMQEEFLGVQRSPSSKDIDKMEGGGAARRASGSEDGMVKDQ